MREFNTIKTVSLPAAAASATTDPIDVGTGPHRANFEVHLELPATPSLANTKSITLTLEECDTIDGSFTTVPTVGNMSVTGANSAGAAAKLFRFYLPPIHKRFIRGKAAVEASGGDNTAKKLTLALDL
jgi:hypothetical protein